MSDKVDVSKETLSTASKATRRKWLEKSKKTRAQKKKEKENLKSDVLNTDLQSLLKSLDKIDFAIRALKQNRLSKKETQIIVNILVLAKEL